MAQRDTRYYSLFVQKWCFSRLEKDFLKYFFANIFHFGSCFKFNDFHIVHIHKKLRRPLLYQLFTEALHISTLVEPNQMELGFVITNDKASYVAKEDSICLFSVARKAALNEQQIKPCVPFVSFAFLSSCPPIPPAFPFLLPSHSSWPPTPPALPFLLPSHSYLFCSFVPSLSGRAWEGKIRAGGVGPQ